jgi:hypothetical protein
MHGAQRGPEYDLWFVGVEPAPSWAFDRPAKTSGDRMVYLTRSGWVAPEPGEVWIRESEKGQVVVHPREEALRLYQVSWWRRLVARLRSMVQ